ncbi:hydroxyethylthiazole kinase [Thermasporomyces composti]|jgi:hydroxyethylthiazole kinase|uniref:Hydroxyethylthiazole kinase n=1 Tax=Thermasporomyces composti TaxID=696763 RepID=A0A3D9V3K0_THECX|nr:hydroxyethylthiazole kinase [Thermasporomyces composti]REF35273.1 hydroxyethylthiazole kinase [Thermasporomyces composti]
MPTTLTADHVADALERLRAEQPLVHCLTNIVAAPLTANALLAVGASPAMVDGPDAGDLARAAAGVLVNIGTVTHATAEGMRAAVRARRDIGGRWVLDPVAAGALPYRAALAAELLDIWAPTVVRGNPSEVLALTGRFGGKGVDSDASPDDAGDAARALAGKHGTTVAVSGPVDYLTDGQRTVRVANGHALLSKVSGAGCVLGALVAGFLAVVDDPLLAATSATVVLTVAGEEAEASGATRPGSFAVALVDQLHAVDAATIRRAARIH